MKKGSISVDYKENRFQMVIPNVTSEALMEKLKIRPSLQGTVIISGIAEGRPALFVLTKPWAQSESVEKIVSWARDEFAADRVNLTPQALLALRNL